MDTVTTSPQSASLPILHGSGQFLTFRVGNEEYGVDILRVQGIQVWDGVTPIPNTPQHILGVINLRGTIVPILDLRRRFHLDEQPFGPTTVVVVVKVQVDERSQVFGLVVDAVCDVYRIGEQQINPPPECGRTEAADFVLGLAALDEKMVILLDIDSLVGREARSARDQQMQ